MTAGMDRHFPTKDALFVAIVADRLQRLIDRARELATADDPGEAFFGFLGDLVDQALANKALIDALSDSAGIELAIWPASSARPKRTC